MLSDYTLDTENFQEIMEEAKNMVVSLYPEWTDFNYHDPGITMLELFSWIKEGQQFFLDQIGLEHKKKYLKLLGGFIQKRKPAKAFVKISTKDNILIVKGTKLNAGNVCFETLRRQSISGNAIQYCFYEKKQLEQEEIREYVDETLHIQMFGEKPSKGDCFYIGMKEPLPLGENIGLYVQLDENITKNRNKITNQIFPMLELSYEFFSEGKWVAVDKLEDTTNGMLKDGSVFFQLPTSIDKTTVHEKEAYYIRIRVVKSDIDIPPIIEKFYFNMISVTQKDTWVCEEEISFEEADGKNFVRGKSYLAIQGKNDLYYQNKNIYFPIAVHEKYVNLEKGEAVFWFEKLPENVEREILVVSYGNHPMGKRCIGIGNGFPYQEFDLQSQDVMEEEVEILVHEIGSGEGYSRWKRVEDFGASKPEDKHYMIDAQEGKLIFGDCDRGMAPEGEIILISFAETLGEGGNVKKDKINQFMHISIENMDMNNPKDAYGGKDEETVEECFLRTRKGLKHPKTAVTYKDYERYVMETPGLMIESCKAVSAEQMHKVQGKYEENTLFIVVKPKGKQELSQNYKKNILAYLENYRMLGTKIEIIAPRYISTELCLDIVTKPHYFNAQDRIEEVVLTYFQKISENFGAEIVYSELYGMIDQLDCVSSVNDITMDVRDSKITRTQDRNILLPPNGVVVLKDIQYLISIMD